MKRIINDLWVAVIIVIIGRLDHTIGNDSIAMPLIEWPADEIVLGYGDTWNVTCKCYKPIVWKPFDAEYEWDPPNIAVSIYNTTDLNMPFGSMLTIANASALMVGRYYCVHSEREHENLDEMLAENVATSIYVYVEDTHQLVVPNPVKYYNNSEGVVVVCKPSHPEVELELCGLPYEPCLPTLDPTKGFFIVGGSYNQSDEFYCKANGTRHSAKLDIINEGFPKPTIHSNVGDYVPIGIVVRLTCTYEVHLARNIEMSWKTLPSYQPTEIGKAIFVGNQTKISMHNRTLIKRDLMIENVTLAHQRTYRCEVFDDKNNTFYHNFKLRVRETPDDFVILSTAHNRTVINRRLNENGETTPIQIIIQYKSYPSNITYEWFRDEIGIIDRNETDDYQQEVTEDYVKLRIKQPKVHHTDSYTVSVQAGTASANFTISVFVYGKPSLSMTSIKAIEGDLAIFSCLAESYPSADACFIFQPCATVPWGNCSIVNETDPGWQAGTDEVEAVYWASATFKIVANVPGIVYCKANNTEGHAMTLAYLMLEDLTSEGVKTDFMKLEIVQPKGWITVGDNVSFVCSVVTLGDTVVMSFEHNGKSYPGTVIQDDLVLKKMQFTLFNVSHHDSGDVFCIVNYGIKPTEQRSLDMEVIEAIAPQLRSGEINQSLTVDALNPFKLECDVGGIPSPTIMWFKDGTPFVYNMSDLTDVTSIKIQYAIPTESGLYECIAENKKGNITITRNVTVRRLKLSEPLLYATLMLLLLTIAFAITSLFLCVKMKQSTGVSNLQRGHMQIVPSFESLE